MFSTDENPPDPPSNSSKNSAFLVDPDLDPDPDDDEDVDDHRPSSSASPSHKLALLNNTTSTSTSGRLVDFDDHKQLPTFSIRDYVFTARQKNIGTNWPFPQQYLKLCLGHGVKELLPPFEPPDSLRNRVCGSDRRVFSAETKANAGLDGVALHDDEVDQDIINDPTERESCEQADCPVVRLVDHPRSLPPLEYPEKLTFSDDHVREEEIPSTVISPEDCDHQELDFSKTSFRPGQETPKLDVLNPPQKNDSVVETSGKKLRLVVKLGSLSEPSRVENITSSITTISDPMASKVCPVCKTFSSTSNTTLNAHIDQCLSVESTSKWAIDAAKLTKHRVKPRKVMRSMTDIYLTAPRCTLEDLDRRNGTNWAADMTLLNAQTKLPIEGKRKRSRIGLPDVEDEGAVYFDSNGTKVRILSRFCNPSIPTTGEVTRSKKHVKGGMQSIDKNIHLGPKHSSNQLKPKIQKKKPCRPLQDGTSILVVAEAEHAMHEKQEKKQSLSHLLETQASTSHIDSGTLRQWVCSKRTGLLKKFNGKYNRRCLEHSLPMKKSPLVMSNQLGQSSSLVEGGHFPKYHNLHEDAMSSPDDVFVERISYEHQINGSRDQSSKSSENHHDQLNDGGTLSPDGEYATEPSRSLGKTSYPRGKKVEVHADRIKRSNSLQRMGYGPSSVSQPFSVRCEKSLTLEDGLSAQQSYPRFKPNKSRKRSALKKSRMHRSIAEMTELVRSPPLELEEQCNQMHNSMGNISGCSYQAQSMGKFDCSSDAENRGTEDFVDELPFGGRGLHKHNSKEGGEDSGISAREEHSTLNSSSSGSEICGLDLASTDDSRVQLSSLQLQCSDSVTCKSDGLETGAMLLQSDIVSKKTFSKEAVGGTISRFSKISSSELRKPCTPPSYLPNSFQSTVERERLVFGNEPLTRMTECPSSHEVPLGTDVSKFFSKSIVELETECGVNERNGCGIAHTQVQVSSGSFPVESVNLASSVDHQDGMSLLSSKIPFLHDQQVVDRDGSGSPVSASSTISHPQIARADSTNLVPESSEKPLEGQDQFASGFSASISEPLAEKAFIFSSADAMERTSFDAEHHRRRRLFIGEVAVKWSDAHFCCAQDKNSLDAASAYQDSQITGQCTMTMMQPGKEKHATFSPNIRPEPDDKMIAPIVKIPDKGPSSPTQKPQINGGFGSSGLPSQLHNVLPASNPVLRLMGKNLMVVSKGEDTSDQTAQPNSSVLSDYMDRRYSDLLGFSSGSTASQDQSSLCRSAHESFAICRRESCDPLPLHCFNTSKGCNSQINSETGERSAQAGNYTSLNMEGFSPAPLMRHGIGGGFNFQAHERMPISRAESSFAYDAKRVVSAPPVQSGGLMREVIVIDDAPENEAELRITYAEPSLFARETQSSFMGNLPAVASYSNLRHANTFPCHMASQSYSSRELPGGSRSDFSVPCPGRGNASPLEWVDNSVISSVKLQSPFMAQTPFPSHLYPTMYYSPSMS